MSIETEPAFSDSIFLDPKKLSRRELHGIAKSVLEDPNKGLVLKYPDRSDAHVHANLPEFNKPNIDRKQLALCLVPHLSAAEKIVPVFVDPRLISF